MEDNIEIFEEPQENININERPKFLTVLCILSWVNAGLWLLFFSCCKLFLTNEVVSKIIGMQKTSKEKQLFELEFDYIEKTASIYLILYLISFIVVYMMWKMKKLGFMIYAPLHLILVFIPFFIIDLNIKDIILSLIIYISFIVMYGKNLKYMK